MTRFERLAEHLRTVGPSTSADIAVAMGWSNKTASSAISHARSYGYVKVADVLNRDRSGPNINLWCASSQPLIRKPGQGGEGRRA